MKVRGNHRNIFTAVIGLIITLSAAYFIFPEKMPGGNYLRETGKGGESISERLSEYSPRVHKRLKSDFQRQNVSYPPGKLLIVGLKQEKTLEIYAANSHGKLHFIRSYPIMAMSGHLGPKLRNGDRQVPEGFYRIDSLNPNSHYHLSLHVNYPNRLDRSAALRDKRRDLGGEIMIHGSDVSAGCIAMGDETAEDLFVLASETGIEKIQVILSPVDFRVTNAPRNDRRSVWISKMYSQLKAALLKLPQK